MTWMIKLYDIVACHHMLRIIKRRPLDLNIETINVCPLKCVFCCNRVYRRQPIVMDNNLFEKIVRQYYHVGGGALGLGSMQSDFFSDPHVIDRMRIIKKYKKRLFVYSTTPLISCKRFSDIELTRILCLFDLLQISVNGHDEESYKVMSGINGFRALTEQLVRIRKIIEVNKLKIRVDLHFRTCNKSELLKSKFYYEQSQIFNAYDIKNVFFSWFGTIKKKDMPKGARIIYQSNVSKKVNCAVANASLAVMADGKVVGCGCIDWLEQYVVGDVRKNSLKEIWRSPKAVDFRNAFAKQKLPSICRECGLYVSMNCMKNKKYVNYKPMDGLYYLIGE